jgi:hypothetical protein
MTQSPNLSSLIPEAILTEVGRIIAIWSHLEHVFDFIYLRRVALGGGWAAELDDPRLSNMGKAFERRVRDLRQHVEAANISHDDRKAWDRALSQLISLRRKRDFLAHGVMNVACENHECLDDKIHLTFKSWRNQKPHVMVHVSLADMHRTRERMSLLWPSLIDLQLRLA